MKAKVLPGQLDLFRPTVKKAGQRKSGPKMIHGGRSRASLGMFVPLPVDAFGRTYTKGPFCVYQRTDGVYIIRDSRLPLGEDVIRESPERDNIVTAFEQLSEGES